MFILKCFDLTDTRLLAALSEWPCPLGPLGLGLGSRSESKPMWKMCGWYTMAPDYKETPCYLHGYIYIYICVCVIDDKVSKHAISTAIFLSKKSGISRALSPCPARHPSPALASGPGCISPSNQEESHGGFRSNTRSNNHQWGTVINDGSTPWMFKPCEPHKWTRWEIGLLGKQGSQLQHSTQQGWAVPEQASALWVDCM